MLLGDSRRKQRGQRRRLEELFRHLDENITNCLTFEDDGEGYDHFHVPSDGFIQHPRTSSKIKTEFCRRWLEKTEEVIKNKPADLPFCKVVACISMPELWASQIIVFFDQEYYENFCIRNSPYDTWTRIDSSEKSLLKERNIQTSLKEQGYHVSYDYIDDWGGEPERIAGQDTEWFYGDVWDED